MGILVEHDTPSMKIIIQLHDKTSVPRTLLNALCLNINTQNTLTITLISNNMVIEKQSELFQFVENNCTYFYEGGKS